MSFPDGCCAAACDREECGMSRHRDLPRGPRIRSLFVRCNGEVKNAGGSFASATSMDQAKIIPLRLRVIRPEAADGLLDVIMDAASAAG